MTTVKEFEKQKESIISCAEVAIGYINEEEYDDAQGLLESISTLTKQLQPPRPTCSTCTHWIDEELKVTKDSVFPHKTCDNLKMWENLKIGSDKKAKLVFINPTKDFGCTFHSDFEVKDE